MADKSPTTPVRSSRRRRRRMTTPRTCSDPNCTTLLSQYNTTDWCSLHARMPTRTPYLRRD